MSHRWDCTPTWKARREGEDAYQRHTPSWDNPHARKPFENDHCREAERAWEDGRRMAELRAEEDRREERHREQRAREEQWRREEREAQWAEEQRQSDEQEAEYQAMIEAEDDFWAEQDDLRDWCSS